MIMTSSIVRVLIAPHNDGKPRMVYPTVEIRVQVNVLGGVSCRWQMSVKDVPRLTEILKAGTVGGKWAKLGDILPGLPPWLAGLTDAEVSWDGDAVRDRHGFSFQPRGEDWIIVMDGTQWGPDLSQYSWKQGCSLQTYTSVEACQAEIDRLRKPDGSWVVPKFSELGLARGVASVDGEDRQVWYLTGKCLGSRALFFDDQGMPLHIRYGDLNTIKHPGLPTWFSYDNYSLHWEPA